MTQSKILNEAGSFNRIERRKAVRFRKSMLLEYTVLNDKREQVRSLSLDFSRDGMRIIDERQLEDGAAAELRIFLPDCNVPVAVAEAESVWCFKVDERSYEKGMRFTKIDEADRKILADLAYTEQVKRRFSI
ncbi:MAG: PilZ domain-containing protein [Candidatus Omnitrophota bacterium]